MLRTQGTRDDEGDVLWWNWKAHGAMIPHLGFMSNHAALPFRVLNPNSLYTHSSTSSGDFLFYYLEEIFSGELMISFEKEKDSPVKYNLVNST